MKVNYDTIKNDCKTTTHSTFETEEKESFLNKFLCLFFIIITLIFGLTTRQYNNPSYYTSLDDDDFVLQEKEGGFPVDFVWGAATSSYQIEGGVEEGGRGASIWDRYCSKAGNILDGSSGVVACDSYHRLESDVKLMKSIGLKAYRFSISWSRIYPNGRGKLNVVGIAFYDKLINLLLQQEIEPWVTLYHWDLPEALQERYEGWLSHEIINDFGNYARTCFKHFGDRVKYWITINESWSIAVQSYTDGTKAPGKRKNASIDDTYVAGHHLLLAHSRAVAFYKKEFALKQKGWIGIANCGDFRFPRTFSTEDVQAADRAMIFQFAWFTDPLFTGEYPIEMRQILGNRLPRFTPHERAELIGSKPDFLGLNHYSSLITANPEQLPSYEGY